MPQVSTFRVNGAALRALRTRRGLSVRQLARITGPGRHPQSIRRLETTADKRIGEVFAFQIANALEVDVAAFTIADSETLSDSDLAHLIPRVPNGAAA
jgi:transcriptional regulator with XRE-family HTH domain